ncbi:hypothetical protein BJ742DRAFT_798073 [Cladochytrium replicatum]|nr:hypothetical protein BJ742DRAFT_798073 [Cladochytrium replicatum]
MNDKILRSVRQQQQSQITKLQSKSESDAELLEFVREYMKRRAEIELDYSRNLEKLNDRFANRKFRKSSTAKGQAVITAASVSDDTSSVSDSPRASTDERGGVGATYVAFATLVHESQELARSRGEIAQKIVSDITDVMKDFTKDKGVTTKKNLEFMARYQQELHSAYVQLDGAKQAYEKAAREAESSRKKYEKPNSGLDALRSMVTRTDADERTEKLRAKWKTASRQLSECRNNYLLALSSVNAAQGIYYDSDLPEFLTTFDERFYRMLSTTLTSYVEMERDFIELLSNSVDQLSGAISKVDSGKDLESFLSSYDSLFRTPGSYAFEPLYNDEENSLVVDEFTKVLLGQNLLQLQERAEKLKNEVAKKEKEIAGVRHMVEVYQNTPSFGNATNPMDELTDIEHTVSLLKTQVVRTEAQIEILLKAKVEPVKKLQIEVVQDSATSSPNNTIIRNQPISSNISRAIAQFGYEAQADNELTVREKEELEVLGEDADGWIKVRSTNGREGYVPSSYIKIMAGGLRTPTAPKLAARPSVSAKASTQTVKAVYDYDASESSELSFRAGDTIEIIEATDASADAWWEGKLARTGRTGTFPVVFTQGWEEIAASLPPGSRRASVASSIISVQASTVDAIPKSSSTSRSFGSVRAAAAAPRPSILSSEGKQKARAIYSYEATCEGELSLSVGEVITILNKNTGSDAWWEGEGANGRGQFPVNYVQLIEEAGRPSVASRPSAAGFKVKALYDFTASDKSELSFKAGDVIRITQSSDPDWWDGELNGRTGSLPKNYVERL